MSSSLTKGRIFFSYSLCIIWNWKTALRSLCHRPVHRCWQYHFFSIQTIWSMNDILMPFHIQAFRNRNKVRSGMASIPHLHYSCVLYHTSQRITLFLWQHFPQLFSSSSLLFFYPKFREAFFTFFSRSQFEKFDSLILGYQISCILFLTLAKISLVKNCVFYPKREQ